MGKTDLRIDWATHEAARYACERWHYSGCLPSGKIVKIGVWEESKFIGVVLFSRGASPFLLKKYDLAPHEGCELTRIALGPHKTEVSRIVRIALKFLRKSCPGLRLAVSFADPEEGHHGGVYQAGGWIYTGRSNRTIEFFIRGKWRHMRGAFYDATDRTPKRTRVGKYRYLMPLDPEMRATIVPLARPYPERVRGAASGTPGIQPGGGGATPTRTLHSPTRAREGGGS